MECPMVSDHTFICNKELCAWWVDEMNGRCAVVSIAKNIGNLCDTLQILSDTAKGLQR